MTLDLESFPAWLGQGDIFDSVPLGRLILGADFELVPVINFGPALLMSHDCALDKRRGGELVIQRLNFLPLQLMTNLDASIQGQLRSHPDELAPLETMYLGSYRSFGDAFIAMSTPTRVPAAYFDLRIVDPNTGDPKDLRASPGLHDTRVGRLSSDRLEVLRTKWNAYWTGRRPR